MSTTGTVGSIRRYPVKSMLGEEVGQAVVEPRGLAGDRAWAVRDHDGKLGSGKSTRRFRRMDGLLALAATCEGDVPVITFPDGRRMRGGDAATDRAISRHVGRPVTLRRETVVSHFDEGPVHLVTTTSLRTAGPGGPLDPRRARANVVLEWGGAGFPEHDWVGRLLAVGPDVLLRISAPMPRCVMLETAQEELPEERGLLRSLGGLTDGMLGVVADVERTGAVSVGDAVVLLP